MRIVFIILGFLFFFLGMVGVWLPVLPTTPFLLISAACFAKGSLKFHNRLINSAIYKKNVVPLMASEGITLRHKIRILSVVTLLFALSIFMVRQVHARVVMIIVLIVHYYYFLCRIKTKKVNK